jgi:uncharacterized protein (TIGR03437 family)
VGLEFLKVNERYNHFYLTGELHMYRFFSTIVAIGVTASSAGAQCYEFAGSGATLQIDITSFASKQDDTTTSNGGYDSKDTFSSHNTLTVGGTTQTSTSAANTPTCVECLIGSAIYSFGNGLTLFTLAVHPNDMLFNTDAWFVTLGGGGNLIPSGVLPQPQAFPPIGAWGVEAQITVSIGSNSTNYTVTSIGPCSNSSGGTPPSISAVVNGASFAPGLVPGSWATIQGTNLSAMMDTWDNFIVDGKLPTTVDGVGVTVGGQNAYVYYISPAQINFIVPEGPAGPQQVVVTNSAGASPAVMATVATVGPAFFGWPNNQVVATRQDFSLAVASGTFSGTTTTPAKPGDVIILWGTGFGPTNPSPGQGEETPTNPTYSTDTPPMVEIDNLSATVYGAALAPGFAGLYQVAIQVPTSLGNGNWPIVATIGGVSSPSSAVITVQQ